MSKALRLVIFDVDGTLVDSQADIVAAMSEAFERARIPVPSREMILSIVGLSLDHAIARLAPGLPEALLNNMVGWYKEAYVTLRTQIGVAESSPLYPDARATLEKLHARNDILLGVATGKSRRGLETLIEAHSLERLFVTQQVSDFHPSKPHPSMVHACLSETGIDSENAVMVGDTSFDMEMAKSAGIAALGVSWGYHPRSALGAADEVIDSFGDLLTNLERLWERTG